MGRVCVVGSFMMDLVVRAERRPGVGETVIGESLDFYLGGKGFNQALASARYGAPTAMVGRVGADAFGDQFLQCLRVEGIDTAHVARDADLGTGAGLPVVDAQGENSIIVVPQANTRCGPEDVDAAAGVIRSASVVLAQLELPLESVQRAFELARDAGARTVLNPAPMSEGLGRFRGLVDVVVPNETEAAALLGQQHEDPEVVAAAVAAELEAPAVLLTLGDRGALLWNRGVVTSMPAHQVDAIDTVGAGDASCGALAAAIAGGASLEDAAVTANAAGALAVTVRGAEPSMPRGDEVRALARAADVVGQRS